jgi:hypothetical protein
MAEILIDVIADTIEISGIVFLMMVLIDFFDVQTRGKIKSFINRSRWNQYLSSSFLGATPGCFGSFINVSMYMHGFLGLGAVSAGMIATCGDEAFVMLALFPEKAIALFFVLFIIAIPAGWLFDFLASIFNIKKSAACNLHEVHTQEKERDYKHYFTVHIWRHIFLKHVLRIIVWTFVSLLAIYLFLDIIPLEDFARKNMGWIILIAALVGIIPESGPHIIFVTLYSTGLIPFSVLLTSSISQDGHGMLPMFSYSMRDSMVIKSYNLLIALCVGWIAFAFGL